MVDLKDVSIITHIRIDCPDRLENLLLRNKMIKSLSINGEFIMVEDDKTQKVEKHLDDDDIYGYFKNDGLHKKNHAYNVGAKLATRDNLIFLDADCIVHPRIWAGLAENVANKVMDYDNSLIYPYNRYALYMTPTAKARFKSDFRYEKLESFIPKGILHHGMINGDGHLFGNCPGGSFFMTKNFFNKVNGFNPNFKGWGYEDTAFLTRVQRLGHYVGLVNGAQHMIFHMHHGDVSKGEVAARGILNKQSHNNRNIYNKVNKMTKPQAEAFSKTWTL